MLWSPQTVIEYATIMSNQAGKKLYFQVGNMPEISNSVDVPLGEKKF